MWKWFYSCGENHTVYWMKIVGFNQSTESHSIFHFASYSTQVDKQDRGQVWSQVLGDPTCCGATQSVSACPRAHAILQQEKPLKWEDQAPQPEKACVWKQRPSADKISN